MGKEGPNVVRTYDLWQRSWSYSAHPSPPELLFVSRIQRARMNSRLWEEYVFLANSLHVYSIHISGVMLPGLLTDSEWRGRLVGGWWGNNRFSFFFYPGKLHWEFGNAWGFVQGVGNGPEMGEQHPALILIQHSDRERMAKATYQDLVSRMAVAFTFSNSAAGIRCGLEGTPLYVLCNLSRIAIWVVLL